MKISEKITGIQDLVRGQVGDVAYFALIDEFPAESKVSLIDLDSQSVLNLAGDPRIRDFTQESGKILESYECQETSQQSHEDITEPRVGEVADERTENGMFEKRGLLPSFDH